MALNVPESLSLAVGSLRDLESALRLVLIYRKGVGGTRLGRFVNITDTLALNCGMSDSNSVYRGIT